MLPLVIVFFIGSGVSLNNWIDSGLFEDQVKFLVNVILLINFCLFEWIRIELKKVKALIAKEQKQPNGE